MTEDIRREPDRPRPPRRRREAQATHLPERELEVSATVRRISWGAIFAGAVIALVTQLGLNLLGASIGFGAIDPATEANPFSGLGLGTGIWLAVSSIIALFLGGFVASHLADVLRRLDGILHGVVTWGLVTLLTFYLMTTALGQVLSSAAGVLGQGLELAGQGVAAVAPGAAREADEQLQAEGLSVEQLADDFVNELSQSLTGGEAATEDSELRDAIEQLAEPGSSPEDREAVVDLLVARTDMSEAEARQTVAQYEERFQQTQQFGQEAQQEARQVSDRAAAAMSRAALWGFIAMVLGAIAAAIGGAVGMPRDVPASAAVRRE